MDHDDESLGFHRRDVDLLALIDAVFGAHAQHLLQLPDERSGARELLGKRAVERLGAGQIGARFDRARVRVEQIVGASVDPARVTVGEQSLHGLGR